MHIHTLANVTTIFIKLTFTGIDIDVAENYVMYIYIHKLC